MRMQMTTFSTYHKNVIEEEYIDLPLYHFGGLICLNGCLALG